MPILDPGIDDGHDHVAAAGSQVPRFRRPNVGARSTPRLAGVVQAPELGEARVVWSCKNADEIVRLRVEHVGTRAECLERLAHGHARRQLYALKPLGDPELPDDSRTYSRMGEAAGEAGCGFTEPDQNLVRRVSMRRRMCAGFEARLRDRGVRRIACRRCSKRGRSDSKSTEDCPEHRTMPVHAPSQSSRYLDCTTFPTRSPVASSASHISVLLPSIFAT